MIGHGLLMLFSLYPWNLGVGGNYTVGNYSNDRNYRSERIALSLDRRNQDLFVVTYEHLKIDDNFGRYAQDNVLIRGSFWIKPEFRLGSIAGIVQSNSIEEGWLIGAQVEGDVPWFGYSADYTFMEFQGWEPLPLYWDITEYPITQWSFGLSRGLGPILFRVVGWTQNTVNHDYFKITGKSSLAIGYHLSMTIYGEWGKSRYALDPYLLVLDNNPDILKHTLGFYTSFRFTPNIYLSFETNKKYYSPAFHYEGSGDYDTTYHVFGFLLRI